MPAPTTLPIWKIHADILRTLQDGNRLVLVAPTGSGKTTQVPQMLLDAGIAGDKMIVVLQPRRVEHQQLVIGRRQQQAAARRRALALPLPAQHRVQRLRAIETGDCGDAWFGISALRHIGQKQMVATAMHAHPMSGSLRPLGAVSPESKK